MIPFVFLLLVPITVQHLHIKGVQYQKKMAFSISLFFVIMTLLIMLRHESVGNDTKNYIYIFNRFSSSSWTKLTQQGLEIGYTYYCKIVSLVYREPQFFLAVTAMVVSAMIFPTYKRLCIDASLTIVLFCTMSTFVLMFSGIRQMLAISIGFIAYEFTQKKRPIPFILTVMVAIAFHTSAFMLIFMYPLYHAKITKKWLLAVVPGLVVVFIFNEQIFSVLNLVLERYTKYDGSIKQTGAYTMIILFAIFLAFAFVIPDESKLDEETVGLRNFLIFALVLQMFAPLHMLAMRMNYYYIIFIPLLMPKIIACRSNRWSQVAIMSRYIMVSFFLIYFFVQAFRGGSLNVFPYHFFWESV